ncbi:MAG: hypothetical protein GXO89_00425 [Chlorobi bacterium]|nr:hypothetical protein [Chlorobiota bacterium]
MKHSRLPSPEKYIRTRAAKLPIHECLINSGWEEKGLATILLSKKQPSGNYVFALYLVDIFCLGLKNTLFNFNFSEVEYNEIKEKMAGSEIFVPCDIVKAHNIIYGAMDYAEELGFRPYKDFKTTEYLLNPELIDDGIDDIEFGKDGKPYYFAGLNDNVDLILETLNRNVGKGNFKFTLPE